MACKCAAQVDKKLEDTNTKLDITFTLNFKTGKVGHYPQIAVVKRDKTKRERLKTIVPSYCPFCGKKYGEGDR